MGPTLRDERRGRRGRCSNRGLGFAKTGKIDKRKQDGRRPTTVNRGVRRTAT